MPRSRSGFSRPRSRRKTAWALGPGSSVSDTVAVSGKEILGAGLQATTEELTLVRVRGSFQAYLRAVAAISDGFHCAIGIGIVTVEAFDVGITAIPGPLTEMSWDGWLYHRFFDLHSAVSSFDQTAPMGSVDIEVDSKAMRKIGSDQIIVAMLEVVEAGTATMTVFFDTRVLFKLP